MEHRGQRWSRHREGCTNCGGHRAMQLLVTAVFINQLCRAAISSGSFGDRLAGNGGCYIEKHAAPAEPERQCRRRLSSPQQTTIGGRAAASGSGLPTPCLKAPGISLCVFLPGSGTALPHERNCLAFGRYQLFYLSEAMGRDDLQAAKQKADDGNSAIRNWLCVLLEKHPWSDKVSEDVHEIGPPPLRPARDRPRWRTTDSWCPCPSANAPVVAQ